ncbi:hypothetical protein RRF57_003521 [Xylaria bambusicola]|uniref:Uncharacterized protein n=1 Tax=Xylaria bambusicola TaxID=326684 RepID=A0AAN7ULX7_9PEZI
MFFRRPQQTFPAATATARIYAETTTPLIPPIQQPVDLPPNPDETCYLHTSIGVTLGMRQTANETSSHLFSNATQSSFVPPVQHSTLCSTDKAGEEDVNMDLDASDYMSTTTFKSTITSTVKKGLADSIWNPANHKARADSVSSVQSFPPPRNTTGEAPIVFSGLTKGPGLKASRWSDES